MEFNLQFNPAASARLFGTVVYAYERIHVDAHPRAHYFMGRGHVRLRGPADGTFKASVLFLVRR